MGAVQLIASIATARRQIRLQRYDGAERALDSAALGAELLARELEGEHAARLDAEHAAARAGAEAGALRVEVRRLCAQLAEL
jgi:hypothetical protein